MIDVWWKFQVNWKRKIEVYIFKVLDFAKMTQFLTKPVPIKPKP